MTEAAAELHDGVTARRRRVRARLAPPVLRLTAAPQEGGAPVADWPLAALRMVDRAGGALRVAPEGSDARLVVADPALAAALEAAMRPRRAALRRRGMRFALALAAAMPLLGLALWHGWPRAADALARAIPASWEIPIGAAVVETLAAGSRLCDAPEGAAALLRLTDRLVAVGDVAGPVALRVLDDGRVNAFAAPGGQVVLLRGLLHEARSAEEVAGVIAHELGHVRHRHGLRSAVRATGIGLFLSALSGGSDIATVATVLVTLSHSRDFEREADADAAATLAATGIGTAGLQAFFARMEERHGGAPGDSALWSYLRSHPASGDRAALLAPREAAAPGTAAPAMTPAEWAAARATCGPAGNAGRR